MDGFYKVVFGGADGGDIGFLALSGGKIIGSNASRDITYRGSYQTRGAGGVDVRMKVINETPRIQKLAMGSMLGPGEHYEFDFAGRKDDLKYEITFRTKFGPLVAKVFLIDRF